MTEAWFYVTEQEGTDGQQQLLLRILERALKSTRQLYLHCDSKQQAHSLSELFWQDNQFIPHGLMTTSPAAQPVVIGFGDNPGEHHDIVVNLGKEIPDHFSRFERIIELVTGDQTARETSRERWIFYKHRGYPVARHELR